MARARVLSGGQLAALSSPIPLPPGYMAEPPWGVWDAGDDVLGSWEDPILIWKSQPSVRKVVDFIARAIASTPVKVYQRVSDTDRQRLTEHPLARVLAAPKAQVVPFRFWHAVVVDWLLFDRWCVAKTQSGVGARPITLTRVQAQRVKFTSDGLGNVFKIFLDGGVTPAHVLDPGSFMYDHGYAPLNANGTTPMTTLQAILQESREAVDYRRAIWKRAGRVPAVITRPADAPKWDDTAYQRFKAGWSAYARGGGQEGGTPILEDGMALAKVEAFSPSDTNDLEGRKFSDAEVASAFHIAPELVGAREGNYSNVQAYREMLYGDALGPYFEPLQQVVNAMLTPDLDDSGAVYAEFDIDAKMRGSFELQAAVTSTAVGGPWMTRAEARARVNLPHLGPHTDELIVPMNVTEGGQASPRDAGAQNLRTVR